jgi:nitrogen fixation protein FixH
MSAVKTQTQSTSWRWFPWAIAAGLLVVIAVNAGLVTLAHRTFPGAVEDHAFDTGNRYNAVLDEAARQAAAGFTIEIVPAGRVVAITLADSAGHPAEAVLTGTARHPVGPDEPTGLNFEGSAGHYTATSALPGAGQWDVALRFTIGGAEYSTTRRIVVP